MNLTSAQLAVAKFMILAGQEVKTAPGLVTADVYKLRQKLHDEEACREFAEGHYNSDLTAIADSLADSLVVILGTCCAYGIDIEPIFKEVMRSNMTKFIDGYRREDGKWIKGPSYSPANIEPLLDLQKTSSEVNSSDY